MEPSGFFSERAGSNAVWHWRLLGVDGEEVAVDPGVAGRPPRFASQGDAESWIGESWRELAEQGVASVVLLEGDREVYGPMSLSA
jgi:hypothetical protein